MKDNIRLIFFDKVGFEKSVMKDIIFGIIGMMWKMLLNKLLCLEIFVVYFGKKIYIFDFFKFFDIIKFNKKIWREILECISIILFGFDVIIFVLNIVEGMVEEVKYM